jgi:hypothetical protein
MSYLTYISCHLNSTEQEAGSELLSTSQRSGDKTSCPRAPLLSSIPPLLQASTEHGQGPQFLSSPTMYLSTSTWPGAQVEPPNSLWTRSKTAPRPQNQDWLHYFQSPRQNENAGLLSQIQKNFENVAVNCQATSLNVSPHP